MSPNVQPRLLELLRIAAVPGQERPTAEVAGEVRRSAAPAIDALALTTIPVGTLPFGVAVAANGNAYVTNFGSNDVTVIDTATNLVVGTPIPVGSNPSGVAVAANGNAYVTNVNSNDVTVIDTATNLVVVPSIPVGTNPFGVAIAPNGNAYVTNFGSNDVTVINTATNMVVGTPIPVGTHPLGVAIAPNGNAYVTNEGSNDVTVIDTATNLVVVPSIPVGTGPYGVAVAPNGKIYVANIDSNDVSVLPPFPMLAGINPTSGASTGGTVVTITGTNLTGASVTIGGNPATGVSVNAGGTQITATTPARTPGPATVTVTTPGGTASLVNAFTYLAVSHATSLTATPALAKLLPPQVYFPFLTATLTDLVTGLPVPGQTIAFSTGSHILGTATTNAQGTAQVSEVLTLTLILLNDGYSATFAGTPTLQPSSAHAGVITP
ncbi:IPT/TIG domain-containing protein [Streptomyces sp. NPDC020096]